MSQNKLKNYKLINELGSGAYGTVYKAIHINTKTKVAIKAIDFDPQSKDVSYWYSLKLAARELGILYKLSKI
jgi:serine/threonine protein kinase